jgi:glycosyltransferase involved in cell wall biosynthesis
MNGTTKKNILFVMQFPPPVHGVSVMNIIIRDSQLINSHVNCEYINLATTKDIKDLRKSQLVKYFLTLKILFLLIYKLIVKRYDNVYITIFPFGFAFYKDAVMVLAAKIFRKKVLLHLHTYGFKSNSEKSKLVKQFYKLVFKNTQAICLSEALIEDIETIYSGKVYILPNGIPQVNFDNNYTIHDGTVRLLYLSNLIKGKGILLILESLTLLVKRDVHFKLRVVGSEGDLNYQQLSEYINRHSLQNYVELVGPKHGSEKFDEYKGADIFLLPSNYDTFGLVLLEAMQFGVPCIASNIGAIPDLLGGGRGILLKELSALELANAIEFLIKNPNERLKMSSLGFNFFTSNFTVEVFERNCLNVLEGNPDRISYRLDKNSQ